MENMTLEQMRDYQSYFFARGMRDPMTMRMPTDAELGVDLAGGATAAPSLQDMETALWEALVGIEAAIKIQDYTGAIQISSDMINTIDNEWPAIRADPPHLLQMDESIRNYHRMANNMKRRLDTQKEFESMQLQVDGIVWSPTDARAVVNGNLLAAGEVMLAERRDGNLRIEVIEEHGVVFQFKSIRFRVPVDMFTPATMLE